MNDKEKTPSGPELVIGLIGAIGTDLSNVQKALQEHLAGVSYDVVPISLIDLVKRYTSSPDLLDDHRVFERYMARMTAGNDFRSSLGRDDAIALLATAAIRKERWKRNHDEQKPLPRSAFVLKSLKTPHEVETLRMTYGKNCVVIAAYGPKQQREKRLAARIAESRQDVDLDRHRAAAQQLIYRDEAEIGVPHGQNVRDTFPLADAFVNASTPARVDEEIARMVDLLFGHPFTTPKREEFGMFQAHGAALRSASSGRQVGAAIATAEGDVIALGTNEVAKAFGGQYWGEDGPEHDHRDHTRPFDSTATMVDSMLADLFARARKHGWLTEVVSSLDDESLVGKVHAELVPPQEKGEGDRESLGQRALVRDVLEYFRPVHAEMAALTTAARLGFSVSGCTLYCTAFPCHECAKHIVAAGISRVVFIEPYPKSRVTDMFDDSISVDAQLKHHVAFEAFMGIAPVKYVDLFTAPDRENIDWELIRNSREPRHSASYLAYIHHESDRLDTLNELLKEKGLRPEPKEEVKP